MPDAKPCPCGQPDCQISWGAHDWSALASFHRDPLSANDPVPRDEVDLIVEASFDATADVATCSFGAELPGWHVKRDADGNIRRMWRTQEDLDTKRSDDD